MMTGHEYAELVARYIVRNFGARGIEVYREVYLGKTIIGKNRRVDMLILDRTKDVAMAIECKYQDSPGTTDEKIPYTLDDMLAIGMPVCVAYAGAGFSEGILRHLAASPIAAYCLPDTLTWERTAKTRELDAKLAMTFQWWDVLVGGKKAFTV